MTLDGPGLIERLRLWLAGTLFLLAGRLHPTYDVWLDDAEPRHPIPDSSVEEGARDGMSEPRSDAPWDVLCRCGHRYARHIAEEPDMKGYRPGCQECDCWGYAAPRSRPEGENVETLEFAAWIVEHGVTRGGDWACAECRPDSDMLVAGFRCVPHRAAEYAMLRDARSTPEEPRDG